ncbi:MAG: asparagine synthase (glutamine-hydrolyzing) [Flavihumibacter sp.]
MCGIAGIIQFNGQPVEEDRLRAMSAAMAHRGPDAEGFFLEKNYGLAHRRLSILDLSTSANQPFSDSAQRYITVFNGELYNYRDVQRNMPEHVFKTTSDTEVLVEWFARKGIEGIDDFSGMFAFAMVDRHTGDITLVRDRFGVKPLYYYQDEERLLFASELRAILASGYVKAVLDPVALRSYFRYQSIASPGSVLEGVRQLPAGHFLQIRNGQLSVACWYAVADTGAPADFSHPTVVKRHIRQLLERAVEKRLVSDVPVGAFLSGGIDSSLVVALMARAGSAPVNTFNISFKEEEFDESKWAQMVARKYNTRHQSIELKPSHFLDELTNALDAMDSPSGDGINSYVVSKAVRQQGITVALSGIGGDELFAGYPFFPTYLKIRQRSQIWDSSTQLRQVAGKMMEWNNRLNLSKIKTLLEAKKSSIAWLYPVFRQVLPDSIPAAILDLPDHDGVVQEALLEQEAIIDQLPLLSQVTVAELMGYTQNTLLKDMDQMSMAVGLELREPFFDHDLVRYVLQVPDSLKFPETPKKLLVESLQGLIPDEVIFRPKKGFTFPWKHWMKNELKPFCSSMIRSFAGRKGVNNRMLLQHWNDFLLDETQAKWMDIWLFVVLEYWLQKNEVEIN